MTSKALKIATWVAPILALMVLLQAGWPLWAVLAVWIPTYFAVAVLYQIVFGTAIFGQTQRHQGALNEEGLPEPLKRHFDSNRKQLEEAGFQWRSTIWSLDFLILADRSEGLRLTHFFSHPSTHEIFWQAALFRRMPKTGEYALFFTFNCVCGEKEGQQYSALDTLSPAYKLPENEKVLKRPFAGDAGELLASFRDEVKVGSFDEVPDIDEWFQKARQEEIVYLASLGILRPTNRPGIWRSGFLWTMKTFLLRYSSAYGRWSKLHTLPLKKFKWDPGPGVPPFFKEHLKDL